MTNSIMDITPLSDLVIAEYIESLGTLKPDSIESLVLTQMLLLQDSTFRKTISALVTGQITLTQLSLLPEINEMTIRVFFDNLENTNNNQRLLELNHNFDTYNWGLFFDNISINVKTFILNKLKNSEEFYINHFDKVPDRSLSRTIYMSVLSNIRSTNPIVDELSTMETQLSSIIPNFNRIVENSKDVLLYVPIFLKNIFTDTFILSNNALLGFILRKMYKTDSFSRATVELTKKKIISSYLNNIDPYNLGYISFIENFYSKISVNNIANFSINPSNTNFIDQIFNDIYIQRILIPKYYRTIQPFSSEFSELTSDENTLSMLIQYFDKINELVVIIRNECTLEINRNL